MGHVLRSLLWPAELARPTCQLLLGGGVLVNTASRFYWPKVSRAPPRSPETGFLLQQAALESRSVPGMTCLLCLHPPGAWWDQTPFSDVAVIVLPALTVISFCLSASLVTVPSVESVMKVEMGRDCFPRVTAQEHWAPCTRAAWKNGYPPPTQVTVSSATQNLL